MPSIVDRIRTLRTSLFDLDNGAGATIDEAFVLDQPIRIRAIRAVYQGATTGTVAAGNFKVGTAVGGAQIVAATAYENAKAVGVKTAGVLLQSKIPAGTPFYVRHTGVAVTQAGLARIEIDYTVERS